MKKLIFTFTLIATQMAVVAQTVNIHFKNGQQIQYPSDNVDYVDFSAKAAGPTITTGQVVDLGLSVYWASCNLGAEKPEDYGDYYAWGETKSKFDYDKKNYSFYNSSTTQYIEIGDDISGTVYDAATVNLGGNWRMPTKIEMSELIDKCSWEWVQIGGKNGCKVTGPNGNSIFLPAGGVSRQYQGETCNYWISTNVETGRAYSLSAYFENQRISFGYKYQGHLIRPVTSNPKAPVM